MTTRSSSSCTAADTISSDVPIFLQKAYHMVDTCDPKICGWSEDGLTFIVKNTTLFESSTIPQFFKHNKFSSFVRQLNFYGFRKVKFSNTLRINHKLEKQTSKYWRFKHDYFRQGRKDLLTLIKRKDSVPTATTIAAAGAKAAVPNAVSSSSSNNIIHSSSSNNNNASSKDMAQMKTEMSTLKQRVASMTKNIDELSEAVKNVTVTDHTYECEGAAGMLISPGGMEEEGVVGSNGNKRKKMDVLPDWAPSSEFAVVNGGGVDDSLFSGVADPLPDLAMSSSTVPSPTTTTLSSNAGDDDDDDDAFVDDLFEAFANEDTTMGLSDDDVNDSEVGEDSKRSTVCPNLMQRIEDSLSTIPSAMHEMVANKLIDAIADTKPIADEAGELFPEQQQAAHPQKVDRSISMDEGVENKAPSKLPQAKSEPTTANSQGSIPLPLAVATLKTILAEYGVDVECTKRRSCKGDAAEPRFDTKSLPVVPHY